MKTTSSSNLKGKRRVIFEWPSDAMSVQVAGDFCGWQKLPLKSQAGRLLRILYLPPGCYEYRMFVDGGWRSDPKSLEQVPNPFGTSNNLLRVL